MSKPSGHALANKVSGQCPVMAERNEKRGDRFKKRQRKEKQSYTDEEKQRGSENQAEEQLWLLCESQFQMLVLPQRLVEIKCSELRHLFTTTDEKPLEIHYLTQTIFSAHALYTQLQPVCFIPSSDYRSLAMIWLFVTVFGDCGQKAPDCRQISACSVNDGWHVWTVQWHNHELTWYLSRQIPALVASVQVPHLHEGGWKGRVSVQILNLSQCSDVFCCCI